MSQLAVNCSRDFKAGQQRWLVESCCCRRFLCYLPLLLQISTALKTRSYTGLHMVLHASVITGMTPQQPPGFEPCVRRQSLGAYHTSTA